jgi:CDP-diacylglycerol--glycerol-3-phosphate 3-phosphatidyltransferase
MLSLSFLRWDLLGPNDFHEVDRIVWLVNWSPLAKAVNTAGVVGLTVLGLYPVALLLAVSVLVVKVGSGLRVMRLMAGTGLHVTSP